MALLELVVKLLNLGRGELVQLHTSKCGLYVVLADGTVRIRRVGLHVWNNIGIDPGVQPLPQCFFGRRNISSFIQINNDLREFQPDLLLGLSADRTLNLFPGPQVIANCGTGFIVGVFLPVFRYGFLADGAVAVGSTAHGFRAWHISSLSATQMY